MKLTRLFTASGLFYSELQPVPVQNPKMLVYNDALAEELGLSDDGRATLYFSGNAVQKKPGPRTGVQRPSIWLLYPPGYGRAVLIGGSKRRHFV